MQAVLEFDPPLPKSDAEKEYCSPEIYLICGDDRFETDAPRWKHSESIREVNGRLRWHDAFCTQPVCRKCKHTGGRRSDKPITLAYALSRYDGAFGSIGTDVDPDFMDRSDSAQYPRGIEVMTAAGKEGKPDLAPVSP